MAMQLFVLANERRHACARNSKQHLMMQIYETIQDRCANVSKISPTILAIEEIFLASYLTDPLMHCNQPRRKGVRRWKGPEIHLVREDRTKHSKRPSCQFHIPQVHAPWLAISSKTNTCCPTDFSTILPFPG